MLDDPPGPDLRTSPAWRRTGRTEEYGADEDGAPLPLYPAPGLAQWPVLLPLGCSLGPLRPQPPGCPPL